MTFGGNVFTFTNTDPNQAYESTGWCRMAVSKMVACANEDCAKFGSVSEIPYAMPCPSMSRSIRRVHAGDPEIEAETRASGASRSTRNRRLRSWRLAGP
jgi:hypothetical protein